jgi:hypothetical protein
VFVNAVAEISASSLLVLAMNAISARGQHRSHRVFQRACWQVRLIRSKLPERDSRAQPPPVSKPLPAAVQGRRPARALRRAERVVSLLGLVSTLAE